MHNVTPNDGLSYSPH